VLRLVSSAYMPSPLPRQVRWNRFAHDCSIVVGLPQITVGSAPALSVSRPAQRSLALQPADLPGRLMRPSTPEAPAALLPPPPLRLLPGGAIQFPGGPFIPLWSSAFSRRTVNACFQQLTNKPLNGTQAAHRPTCQGTCGSPVYSLSSVFLQRTSFGVVWRPGSV
jgi:hypothetical protein